MNLDNNIFYNLVMVLRQNGYFVNVALYNNYTNNKQYYFAEVTGKNITGGFCTIENEGNPYLKGKIAVDNINCFDKWRKCAIILPIPRNDKEIDFLLKKLEWLGTDEGYRVSNEYDFANYVYEYKLEDE